MNHKSKQAVPTARKPRGRPRITDEKRRTRQVGVSVNLAEEREIARRAGLNW